MRNVTAVMFWFLIFNRQPVLAHNTLVDAINSQRQIANVRLLKENPQLTASAIQKACDMEKRNYWSHQDPEGRSGWHFFIENGYRYRYAGENLALDFADEAVVNAWMASPKHKEILLKPFYREVGIGKCGRYTVAHFGAKN